MCIFLVCSTLILHADSYVDSLKATTRLTTDPNVSCKAMLELSYHFFLKDSMESMFECTRLIDSVLSSSSYKTAPSLLFEIGLFYEKIPDFDGAIEYYQKAFERAKTLDDKQYIIRSSNRLSYVYSLKGNYDIATEGILNNLNLVEEKEFKEFREEVFVYSAFVFRNTNNFEKAFFYFNQALSIIDTTKNDSYYHVILHELGNLYAFIEDFDKALAFQQKALIIRERLKQPAYLSFSYHDIGETYKKLGDYKKALYFYYKSIELTKKYREDLWGLTASYANASDSHFKLNNDSVALLYLDSAKNLGKQVGKKDVLSNIYMSYFEYYNRIGNYKKALEHYIISREYEDSVSGENISKQINLLNARFQSERKDKELLKNQATIKRQRTLIGFSTIGSIVIGFFLFGFYKLNRKLKIANHKLFEKNQYIQTQHDEIISQRDEIETQRDLVISQKSTLESINHHLTESISYALNIQQTMLPPDEQFKTLFSSYFIIHKPLDIVSGDFYWLFQEDNRVYFAVADCTGHGVSGAFMSILGISFLNEIVRYKGVKEPSQIIEDLRSLIIEALRQKDEVGSRRDGMDMSLCMLDVNSMIMTYCGANNPCWVIKNKDGFAELKPNKNPVAIHIRMEPFTQQTIQLEKGDLLYLFSDGFADQFGGPDKKRFGSKRFRELLIQNADKNLSIQKEILESTFNQWIGTNHQVDDVTILGVRVN